MRGATGTAISRGLLEEVSIHAPHARGDGAVRGGLRKQARFNPRPTCGGRQGVARRVRGSQGFNPRPSCEGRPYVAIAPETSGEFQSTPLMRGATGVADLARQDVTFQSTPLMRGATTLESTAGTHSSFQSTPLMRGATVLGLGASPSVEVSIHAPHARGDKDIASYFNVTLVSIHAPHARGDRSSASPRCGSSSFNPRPSCEGRRERAVADAERPAVSIHAPHARGDLRGLARPASEPVSIHAPHARGDDEGAVGHRPVQVSIHAPHARGDGTAYYLPDRSNVSIHAPHARGDVRHATCDSLSAGFNPRPSCEGRPERTNKYMASHMFQSTPLMRGATCSVMVFILWVGVSIHAPHARGDLSPRPLLTRLLSFNPRPSCEGRRG